MNFPASPHHPGGFQSEILITTLRPSRTSQVGTKFARAGSWFLDWLLDRRQSATRLFSGWPIGTLVRTARAPPLKFDGSAFNSKTRLFDLDMLVSRAISLRWRAAAQPQNGTCGGEHKETPAQAAGLQSKTSMCAYAEKCCFAFFRSLFRVP